MLSGQCLQGILSQFAQASPGWAYPRGQSEEYQLHHGGPAGFACSDSVPGVQRASVAIANLDNKRPNHFEVTNIIPADTWHLTMDQYNAVGKKFAEAFRKFLKRARIPGAVRVHKSEKGLSEIIPGTKCRRFFESWLHTPTPISHPSDVYQLDRFTCALYRYQPKVNLYEVERYLVEDRK